MQVTVTNKNPNINQKKISIDFRHNNIFLISGRNGIGKTTWMEQVLYGENNDISFSDPIHFKVYNEQKHLVFSYVPQNIPQTDLKVSDYLSRSFDENELNELKMLLSRFELNLDILTKKIKDLSGGELVKITVISSLLKKTPYIFLDEPTNNLDNKSVELLIELIKEYSLDRKFIIISHDPRMILDSADKLSLSDQGMEVIKQQNLKLNPLIIPKEATAKKSHQIASQIFFKSGFFFLPLVSVLAFIMITILNNTTLNERMSWDSISTENVIAVQSFSEDAFSTFNFRVASGLGLDINGHSQNLFVHYSDIPEIYALDGVEQIIMYDNSYIFRMEVQIDEGNEDLLIVNPPALMYEDFNAWVPIVNPNFIISGSFPADGAREVTLSLTNLNRHFGLNFNNPEDAIGQTIYIQEIPHTIAGIHQDNVIYISFHEGENFGFMSFSPDTFDQFSYDIFKFRRELNWWSETAIDPIFIFTRDDYENTVLSELIRRFPDSEFFSSVFVEEWVSSFNMESAMTLVPRVLLYSIIMGLLLTSLMMEQIKTLKSWFADASITYLIRKKVPKDFFLINIISFAFIAMTVMIFSVIYSNWGLHLNLLFAINFTSTTFILVAFFGIYHKKKGIKNLMLEK